MNVGSYESIFTCINEKQLTLIDFTDYANRLLNNGKKDLYQKPDLFISIFTQAERLLNPDVLNIDVSSFYQVYLENEQVFVQSIKSKRLPVIMKNILAQEKPKSLITEIINGLKSLSKKPVVISIDSPQKWLQEASKSVKGEGEISLSLDEIERASMYIAEFLRSFSTLNISAIVIKESENTIFTHDELLERYQPITNVAKHYKWSLGLQMDTCLNPTEIRKLVDFCLISSLTFPELTSLWEEGQAIGGGLDQRFWEGQIQTGTIPKTGLLFGKIPADAEPETVLSQIQNLRN
ncbi:hypothetical protein [Bacillus marasmi]|uniref:hypothetical protein n=1 Tax=Bacillus marasmi TaxID=1926279 RepID=UPI0011C8726D|nr:hypothetical protein [Bacillus marasmi]